MKRNLLAIGIDMLFILTQGSRTWRFIVARGNTVENVRFELQEIEFRIAPSLIVLGDNKKMTRTQDDDNVVMKYRLG